MMGIRAPNSWIWLLLGPAVAAAVLVGCAALAWLVFGEGGLNWFVQHAHALSEALARTPPGVSLTVLFWIVTLPAMIFSPFAEEFLYRGYMLAGAEEQGRRTRMIIQASAFALVHLAHYGLMPFQPALILIWLPSMFVTALALGWIVVRSGSLWPAIVSHAVFNLGMNGIVFLFLPELIAP